MIVACGAFSVVVFLLIACQVLITELFYRLNVEITRRTTDFGLNSRAIFPVGLIDLLAASIMFPDSQLLNHKAISEGEICHDSILEQYIKCLCVPFVFCLHGSKGPHYGCGTTGVCVNPVLISLRN